MDMSYDVLDTLPRDCRVDIDVAQLTQNVRILKTFVDRPVLVVVKANGYGHGYANAAHAFIKGGVDYLGVVTLSEGLLLRRMGIMARILIVGGILPDDMVLAAQAGLEFFVWHPAHVETLRAMPKDNLPLRVHLKIDTGMGRNGCMPEEALAIAQAILTIKDVELTGLCTHFASADVLDVDDTKNQIAKFDQVISGLANAGIKPRIIHAANSPGGLYFPHARYDMVRFGIVAYGVPPDEGMVIPAGIKSALTWRSRIVSTKILPAGHGVGYGSEYKMPEAGRIGVCPVGYGDGFRRVPKKVNTVLVEGEERKVLGRMCMDHCMIDLSGFGDIMGAEVVLIGQQGDKELSVETVARRWNTNPYDVYVGIAARVPRLVV
jgi:alanine racemase